MTIITSDNGNFLGTIDNKDQIINALKSQVTALKDQLVEAEKMNTALI